MLYCTANLKGGVGKTTIAVHFATWLREKGCSVAFVDADMQASSSQWIHEVAPDMPLFALQDPNDLLEQIPALKEQFDIVIADGPAGMAELSRAILLHAEVALILCGPSALDLRASSTAVRVIRQAQVIRKGPPEAVFIANKVQEHTKLSRELLFASETIGVPMANTPVHFRQVYADAPGQGKTVFSMGYRAKDAVDELNILFDEVLTYGQTPTAR